ncbi:phosphatidate cytidylyltransferase [Nocardiopsis gilva YIM 90087]|uniref:Phosphatidate cytidylyltransferase n=1 Tax=Nocardiopsis gilva YIM 90087 TaxID=1235441 RepID=A0A223SAB6_9ACTN|nr:phosphatidate cytidylyltransferase [Nocardiopsis gilva]ASU85071.1 phosphatidate cytidylyltransferase [Nocardiopsis gilva YIM 90087]
MIGAAQAAPYIVGVLGVGGVAVWASGKRELVRRWFSWVMIAPVVGCAHYLGAPGIAALAAAIALVAMVEYGRAARLGLPETVVAASVVAGAPLVAWLMPDVLWRFLLVGTLAAMLVPVLAGDERDGARRAAFAVFGMAWLAGLTGLVLLGPTAFSLCVAVAVADVGAWFGGRLLVGPPLSPLSPAKRWGGVLGGAATGLTVLALFGALTPALAIAVVVAAPLGDLLESMIKRGAGVKDTGGWLPGMGGLLDRIDSLLLALPVAVVLS